MKQFSKVRLITDKFISKRENINDIGNIIEVYPDGKFEVEFSNPETGEDYAMIVTSIDDLTKLTSYVQGAIENIIIMYIII